MKRVFGLVLVQSVLVQGCNFPYGKTVPHSDPAHSRHQEWVDSEKLRSAAKYAARDLFIISKGHTGSSRPEIHVLSASSHYKNFSLQTDIGLPDATDESWVFLTAENHDLFAIHRNGGSGTTEVRILSASSNYKDIIEQTETLLPKTGTNWTFLLAPNRDLFAINRSGTHGTEVKVLSASSRYKSFIEDTETALPKVDQHWVFLLSSYRDLLAINKHGPSGATEVMILSAESQYKKIVDNLQTTLHATDRNWTFALGPNNDIIAMKKKVHESYPTELHFLASANAYKEYSMQFATELNELGQATQIVNSAQEDTDGYAQEAKDAATDVVHSLIESAMASSELRDEADLGFSNPNPKLNKKKKIKIE